MWVWSQSSTDNDCVKIYLGFIKLMINSKVQIFHNSAQQKSRLVRLKFIHLVTDW